MLNGISLGIKTYYDAHKFIKANKLWIYVLLPGLINILLFFSTFTICWNYSDQLGEFILSFISFEDTSGALGIVGTVLKWFFWIFLRLIFLILYLFLYKYIVLIIMSPVLAILSEKTDKILTGNDTPFELKQFINDVLRGIVIAVRNLVIELTILIILFIFSYIPILGWISPILMLIVEFFFYGFSMIDYSNERKKLTVKESSKYIYNNKGLAIANGGIFYLLLLVPIVGLMIGPSYGVVAATIATNKCKYLPIEKKLI